MASNYERSLAAIRNLYEWNEEDIFFFNYNDPFM